MMFALKHLAHILLILQFLGRLSHGWQLPQVSFNLFNRPKIPQFILDANHPWIKENRVWLERAPEPQHDLCDLHSPLRGPPKESHGYPADLFKRLEVDNNRVGIHRSGWDNAVARLREMKKCPAALEDAEVLHVDIYVNNGLTYGEELPEPPEELPPLFAEVLDSMPNLKRLDWGVPAKSSQFFEKAFVQRNLSLPSLQHLVPGAFSDYLVPVCRNIKVLEAGNHWSWRSFWPDATGPHLRLVRFAALAKNITRFSMTAGYDGWTTTLLGGR